MNWDRAAAHYDRQVWLERAAIRAAIALAHPGPADRVLDVATGTGAVLRALAPLGVADVVGIDRSAAMLARAPQHLRLIEADATALPFPAASFDVVFASYVLHVLEADERPAVIRELRRVAAPGARVVTITPRWRTDPRPWLRSAGLFSDCRRTAWLGYPSLIVRTRPEDG